MNFEDNSKGTKISNGDENEIKEDFTISINNDELCSKYDNFVEQNKNEDIKAVNISKITNYISEKYSNEHNDKLFSDLLESINKGNNRLVQHMFEQKLIIKTDWVDSIQEGILTLERILAHPKLSIRDERDLVKVEKAKRVDAVAVRHLSTHTQFIKLIKDDGSVVPSNVMTRNLEEEQAIYENRFLYALLQRMKAFVEKRYNVIVEYAKVKDNTALSYSSTFKHGLAVIDCHLNVDVKVDKELNQEEADSTELLKRLEFIKEQILSLEATPFMQLMKKSKIVRPPIQRTNILISNPEYSKCYALWVQLASYDSVGYSVNAIEKELPIDENYYKDLTQIVATSAQVMLINNKIREAIYADVSPSKVRQKEFKVKKNISLMSNVFSGKQAKEKDILDVYYEKMKSMILHLSNLTDALAVSSENEIPRKALFKTIYNQVQNINNEMFEDILKLENLEEEKKETDALKQKYRAQKKLCERYAQLKELKEAELKKSMQDENVQMKKLKTLELKIEKQKALEKKKAEREKLLKEKRLLAKQKEAQRQKELAQKKKLREKQKQKQKKEKEKLKKAQQLKKQKEKEKQMLAKKKAIKKPKKRKKH